MSKTTLVLLHGAGIGAWAWERVISNLSTPAVALDVPGRVVGATPQGCADALAKEIDRRVQGDVVVVLHSLTGVLAPGLAHHLGARLKRCVFLAAVIPPSGGAFIDAIGGMNKLLYRLLFLWKPKGLQATPSMIRQSSCNDLDPATADEVVKRYAAEFPGLYLKPTDEWPAGLDSTYVKLLSDKSVSVAQQERMIARLSKPRVVELDAGHLAMLSQPAALARVLDEEAAS